MNPYETSKLLHEYLLFHYGTAEEILPWNFGPAAVLDFPVRTVFETLDWSRVPENARALDLGCAVGRSSLELSRRCREVIGIDFSESFIRAAETIRLAGSLPYERHDEGNLRTALTAYLPAGARPERVRFETGDAMNLRADLGDFDVIHAANLLCRLPEPERLLARLPDLAKPGAQLVLTTPCTWLEEYTPRENWPAGGTLEYLRQRLEPAFKLQRTMELPFLIRETRRKFQWTVAQGSVWTR